MGYRDYSELPPYVNIGLEENSKLDNPPRRALETRLPVPAPIFTVQMRDEVMTSEPILPKR